MLQLKHKTNYLKQKRGSSAELPLLNVTFYRLQQILPNQGQLLLQLIQAVYDPAVLVGLCHY